MLYCCMLYYYSSLSLHKLTSSHLESDSRYYRYTSITDQVNEYYWSLGAKQFGHLPYFNRYASDKTFKKIERKKH